MISEDVIQEAVRRLVAAASPKRVILFGSYGRGDPREGSDLDFFVVKDRVESPRREMVLLHDVLRPLRIPADVLVASEEHFARWAATPGTVMYEAERHGRVVYEV